MDISLKPNRCATCFFPRSLCLCAELVPQHVNANIVVIMNKSEYLKVSNSGRLLALLMSNCKINIRGLKESPLSYDEVVNVNPSSKKYVFFPSEDAIEFQDSGICSDANPTIIVPDGNWGQGAKIARKLSAYASVEAIKLPFIKPSSYRLRYNPNPSRLSTFESVALLLKDLEGDALYDHMSHVFQMMVNRVLLLRGKIRKETLGHDMLFKG